MEDVKDSNSASLNMHKPEMKFSKAGLENCLAEEEKSATAENNCKGKEKINYIGCEGDGSLMDHAEGVYISRGSSFRLENLLYVPHRSDVLPRTIGKKRLVRDGSVSPKSTVLRLKQFHELVHGKGKEVVRPHASMYGGHINIISLSDSAVGNNGEASGTNIDSIRDECCENKGGRRSVHSTVLSGCMRNRAAPEVAPVMFTKSNHLTEPSHAENMLPSGIAHDADPVFRMSSWEPSSSRSSGINIGKHLNVSALAESSEMRGTYANYRDCVIDEESEARASNVESDEMVFRELQKTLCPELPIPEDFEVPSRSTRESHARSLLRTSPNSSNWRGVRASFSYFCWNVFPFEFVGDVQVRVTASASLPRSSNRTSNQRRAEPSRTRNLHLQLDMNLEMRLNIINAMEDIIDNDISDDFLEIDDFDDSDYERYLALAESDESSDEDTDYSSYSDSESYSSLDDEDENEEQDTGATDQQINSLPLSIVQTENSDDVCAICLDSPAIGETIRHLPCLHKYHKDVSRSISEMPLHFSFMQLIDFEFDQFSLRSVRVLQCIDLWLTRKALIRGTWFDTRLHYLLPETKLQHRGGNLKNLVDAGKEAAAVVNVLDEVASRKMLRTEAALVAVRDEAASNTNLKNIVDVGAPFSVPGCDRKPVSARLDPSINFLLFQSLRWHEPSSNFTSANLVNETTCEIKIFCYHCIKY
ncbi:hypothetical protein V6N11_009533 [Hibiscus sabdariffa]|uniref:Uncharacterized protein n=1 Tax=Hibiscus sabdariffa TaxID=183260 RepID=A0ABR2P633_9ROSI